MNVTGSPNTLLIVEDNSVYRQGLHDILSLEGFTVLSAANGQDALEKMQSICPDLIIADIAMPVMDGITFFNRVRERLEWITIPFIFLTARSNTREILAGKNLGAEDYLVKPVAPEELLMAVQARLKRAHQLRMAQLQKAYEASLSVLANAIDIRDAYTYGHVERVTAYARVIGKMLGWTADQLDTLRYGSILHDIGKIFIRESTLFKRSSLSAIEWREIRTHPQAGAEMISNIPYLKAAMPIVRHHHERWDGSGYPDGLAGEKIPIAARIVAVADGFDAMTSNRPYRQARPLQTAVNEILNARGSQFDPAIVDAFQKAWFQQAIQPIWQAGQDQFSPQAKTAINYGLM